MARGRPEHPGVVYTRAFSHMPGPQAELDRILLRWELALARRARELLQSEGEEPPRSPQ